MSYITVRDASFGYDAGVVVRDLNFTVDAGDYLCVVGENGSGKSTLMKGLLRLKQPMSGEVSYDEGLRRGDVGYLPQQNAAQRDFPAGVFEVVLSGRLSARGLRPFYTKADREIARKNMEVLGVGALERRSFSELSGGQQQRVLLARALCSTRSLLLLDEPVAGLDPLATADLYAAVRELNREHRITVVMVSHDIRSAVEHASHILHLQREQRFFGSAADYAKSEIGQAFLGGVAP